MASQWAHRGTRGSMAHPALRLCRGYASKICRNPVAQRLDHPPTNADRQRYCCNDDKMGAITLRNAVALALWAAISRVTSPFNTTRTFRDRNGVPPFGDPLFRDD